MVEAIVNTPNITPGELSTGLPEAEALYEFRDRARSPIGDLAQPRVPQTHLNCADPVVTQRRGGNP